jgi:FkbM family methyltransferase
MPSTLSWLAQSIQKDGILETLTYLKNGIVLRYIRGIKKHPYMKKTVHGTPMYLDVNDPGISRTLAVKGTREQDQVYVVRRELKQGMCVLDIGANIGSYALLEASLIGAEGTIYALEPSPQNFSLLNKNIELNKLENIILPFQLGAANHSGIGKFYLHSASNLHTFHPQKYREFADVPDAYQQTLDVEIVNIGEFLKDKKTIDFIRMDIEGFEVEVLEGLMDGIRNNTLSPKILFEVHRPKYDDVHHSMRSQLQQLFELGYKVKTLISSDESLARFHERGYQPEKVIRTDGVKRGIYNDFTNDDASEFICDIGFVRAALLVRT